MFNFNGLEPKTFFIVPIGNIIPKNIIVKIIFEQKFPSNKENENQMSAKDLKNNGKRIVIKIATIEILK